MKIDKIFNVKKKVIVITGGCGLLGKTISESLNTNGAQVIIIDKNFQKINQDIDFYLCDLRSVKEIKETKEKILRKYGTIDVLINNHQAKPSGFTKLDIESFDEKLWDEIVDVNLKATFFLCKFFGESLKTKGGSIINFASTYGLVSSNKKIYKNNSLGNPVAYSASKGGIISLTKYLACYWAEFNIRVNCVTPHGVWNNHEKEFEENFIKLSPMKRMMKPDEILGLIFYLSSDASSYSTGSNFVVDGGWTAW